MSNIFIIAEAGVNHNGDEDMALKLVDAAVSAGADAIKFQTFKAENLVTRNAPKAHYQKKSTNATESQLEMLKRLELSHEAHHKILTYCKKNSIEFLSTAFDLESLDFLVNDLKLTTLKIPSGEITNGPLILAHARTGRNLIVSTGMARMEEIEDALGVIAFGYMNQVDSVLRPSRVAFEKAYASIDGQTLLQEKVTILHCTTEYPAPLHEINLNAMSTMRDVFDLNVGYSDHSKGIIVPIAAAALGANLIEKHFTLDNSLPGPDHQASLEPKELKGMVEAIRAVEQVMGNGLKAPMPSETRNLTTARKCLVAAERIKKGELFSENNLSAKRPATGKSPMEYWHLIGQKSQQDYLPDEVI